MDLWAYKISRDYGFAPNPFFGFCTLACCKPNIRRQAAIGDLVVGCGSSALKLPGHIIFAMRVTEKITFEDYWEDPRFVRKRPVFTAGIARAYGDNIYHRGARGQWIQEDSHHSFPGGVWNNDNASRDLSADAVLISTDFVYWGRSAPEIPAPLRYHGGEDLYPNVRDYRRHFSDEFKTAVNDWFESLRKGRRDRPIKWQ